jgi:O-antigen/teichoic acid export membrane protein
LTQLGYAGLLLAVLPNRPSISTAVACTVVRLIAFWLVASALAWRGGLRIRPWNELANTWRPTMVAGGWFQVSSIANTVNNNIDRILIGVLIGPAATGIFDVAAKLVTLVKSLPLALAPLLYRDVVAEASASGDGARLSSRALSGGWVTTSLTAFGGTVMATVAYPALEVWIGGTVAAEDIAAARTLVIILLPTALVTNATLGRTLWLRALGRESTEGMCSLLYLALNALLSIVLIVALGLIGAAVATAASSLVYWILILRRTGRRESTSVAAAVRGPLRLAISAVVVALLMAIDGRLRGHFSPGIRLAMNALAAVAMAGPLWARPVLDYFKGPSRE